MGNCTVGSIIYQNAGSEKKAEFAVTLSSSYATGGDSFTAAQIGFAQINKIILETEKGYFFEADISSDKLSAKIKAYSGGVSSFTPAGTNGTSTVTLATTVDEVVAVSAGTGTLANIPAIIQNVYATAATVTGNKVVIPTGTSPATGQVAATMTTGVLTFNIGTDVVTSAKVTYVAKTQTNAAASQTFTGTAATAAAASEVAGGTNLTSTPGAISVTVYGY